LLQWVWRVGGVGVVICVQMSLSVGSSLGGGVGCACLVFDATASGLDFLTTDLLANVRF
jgi:hypothetical protein